MYSIEELVSFEKKAEQAMFHFKKNFNYSRVDEFDLICDFKKKVLKIVFNQLSWWDEGGGNGGSFRLMGSAKNPVNPRPIVIPPNREYIVSGFGL